VKKVFLRAAIYKKSPQNKLNLIKLYTRVIFEVFVSCTNASGGPHVARGRVFETPVINHDVQRTDEGKKVLL
jgi:hypothetical protein